MGVTADEVASAFEYAYPMFALATTRWRAVGDPSNPQRHAPNTLQHIRHLSDARSSWITAPNNDTLYSNAWLDLSQGPVRISMCEQTEGRYWSVALMDAFTNHFGLLGQRLDGTGPVDVYVVGPAHWGMSQPGRTIFSPGDDAWLFARFLVDGPHDLPLTHAMQDRLTVNGPGGTPYLHLAVPVEVSDPANFLAVVNEMLGRNPPPTEEEPLLAAWQPLGLCPGERDAWERLDDSLHQAWQAHIAPALERVRSFGTQGRRNIQGWIASDQNIGNFGPHHSLRASVALGGLGALEPAEAMYFVKYDDTEGEVLDGQYDYELRIPSAGIAVDSFWSFTLYEPNTQGQRFLYENEIDRYAIGSRTPGLRYLPDGSMVIAIRHTAPEPQHERANWLPAPAGRFQIALRAYLPRQALRSGTAQMPCVFKV